LINYYDVLGVARDAEESAIRERFRVMAREAHPDRFREPEKKKTAEDRFQLLTEAVNVLTSVARRKAHDFELDKHKPAAQDPQSIARVYLSHGVKSYKEGNYSDAIQQFDMAVKHYDKDPKAFHYLAMSCLKVVGQVRKGADAIEAAIKLDPNNAIFHRDAGKLYAIAGLNSKAERHLEEVLTWLPEDPETQRLLQEVRTDTKPKKTPSGFFGRKG
jgi:curved DNA-binding protein CbpA